MDEPLTEDERSILTAMVAGSRHVRDTDGHSQIEYRLDGTRVDPDAVERLRDREFVEWDEAGVGNRRTTEVRLTPEGRAEAERLRSA